MAEPGDGITLSAAPDLRGPGAGRRIRYFFSGIWLLYLIQPVSALFGHHQTAPWIAGGLAITVGFCAVYVWMINTFDESRQWHARMSLPALFLLAVLSCVVYGSDWITLWIYVSAATGYVVQGRGPAVRAVLAVTGCFALLAWTSHSRMSTFTGLLLPVVLLGLAMAGFRTQIQLMRELSLARETVAKLAASEERLRLARDLHDVTGQSLSMITLKSEVARRLLSRLSESQERDAAIHEAEDISEVSRQTLHDIREAVSGYRRPTLAVEIITARAAVESAGVHLDEDPGLTLRSGTFDAEAEAALAWCLREATTNVLRHSGARNCRVRLTERGGELALEVSDDGHGLQGLAGQPGGSGLRGMSERLTALGGRLSFGHARASAGGGCGLRLTATVPSAPQTAREAAPATAYAGTSVRDDRPVPAPEPARAPPHAETGVRDDRPAVRPGNVPAWPE